MQTFSEPLICCYYLGSSKSGMWSIGLDLTDHRDSGTKAPSNVIIPWSLPSWWNGNVAGLGNSGEGLAVSGLLFSQCKTKELRDAFRGLFWSPEVLSWEDKVVDKGRGQTVEAKALSLGEEKKSSAGSSTRGVLMLWTEVAPLISSSARSSS